MHIINVLFAENNRLLREDRNDIVPKGSLVGETVRNVLTGELFFVEEEETIVKCQHCMGIGECPLTHECCWNRMDQYGPTCNSCKGSGEALKFTYNLVKIGQDEINLEDNDVVEF